MKEAGLDRPLKDPRVKKKKIMGNPLITECLEPLTDVIVVSGNHFLLIEIISVSLSVCQQFTYFSRSLALPQPSLGSIKIPKFLIIR